jgi:methyl-accepting chemotaxis protein
MFRNRLMLMVVLYAMLLAIVIGVYGSQRLKTQVLNEEGRHLALWAQIQQEWVSNQLEEGGTAALYQFVSAARDALGAYSLFICEPDGRVVAKRDCAEVPKPLGLSPERAYALESGAEPQVELVELPLNTVLVFTCRISDRRGEHSRILEAVLPAAVMQEAYQKALQDLLVILAASVIVITGGVLLILYWNVVRPVRRINKELHRALDGQGADLLVQFPHAGSAEIRAMVASLEKYFLRARELAATVREQSYRLREQAESLGLGVAQDLEGSRVLAAQAAEAAQGAALQVERAGQAHQLLVQGRQDLTGLRARAFESAQVAENAVRAAGLAEGLSRSALALWGVMDQGMARGEGLASSAWGEFKVTLQRLVGGSESLARWAQGVGTESKAMVELAIEVQNRSLAIDKDTQTIQVLGEGTAAFAQEVAASTHEHSMALDNTRAIAEDIQRMAGTLTEKAAQFRFDGKD